ncbi:MAG: beta-1,6-N-acetylglucosaminyltransferase [Geminicoccaceae bacterium]
MRLAYSISGYKLPRQFEWLLNAIWHEDDHFAVHVDAKTDAPVFDAMRAAAAGRDNVRFIARERVVWMGMGLVNAEMRAIGDLMERDGGFDYLVSLSMQDYPLRSRKEIVAELEAAPGLNYIRMLRLDEQPFNVRRRPYLMSFELENRLLKTPLPRPVPASTPIRFKGSWWRVLSREFCEWLVHSPVTGRYLDFLRHVQAPDELLFQNLIMASPCKGMLADDYRHLVHWPGGSGSPDTVTMLQHDKLATSSMWYVRKVDETVDARILHALAERIGAPVPPRPELAA